MNRPLPLSLAVALALGSSAAHALGLGGVVVKSELNQPLRAEIPVIASTPEETKALQVRLASAEDFARVGLSIGSMAVPLSFDIGTDARGKTVILVSSDQPVREPFVSFLVEVNWANGRLLREYSVLLDPPVLAPAVLGSRAAVERLPESEPLVSEPLQSEPSQAPAAAVTEPAAPAAPVVAPEQAPAAAAPGETASEVPSEAPPEARPEPVAEAEPAEPPQPLTPPPEPEPAPEPAPAPPAAQTPGEYGPVASGETLWEVASITRPNEAVSMNQMLLAILRANPSAFFQDNVNALKRGAVLRIPTAEEISAISVAEAAAEVLAENRTWIESTQPTLVADAGVVSSLPPLPGSTGGSKSSRLELVPPAASGGEGSGRPGQAGGAGTAALTAEVTRAKEALASSQIEVSELRSRVKELEGINQKSERLIELKNSELKGLQDRLAAAEKRAREAQAELRSARAEASRAEEESAAAIAAAAAAATAAEQTPLAEAPGGSSAPSPADVVATETENDVAAQESNPDQAVVPAPVEVKPLPEPEPAVAVPVEESSEIPAAERPWYLAPWFLGLGALVLAVLAALGLASRKRKEKPVVPRSSVAGAFADGVGSSAGAADTGDSVEGDLLNALALDPTDLNTHLNVLEYFYTRGDADKFEAAAEAMYGQISDEQAPEWQAALLMGMELCPGHPLFNRDHQDAGASAAPGFESDTQSFADAGSSEAEPWRSSIAEEPVSAPVDDFQEPAAVATSAAEDFDFELTETDLTVPAVDQPAAVDSGLSFDFELEKPTPAAAPAAPVVAPAAAPTQAPTETRGEALDEDAVATKIDLARAYLDMGDSDGARSMLEEVLTEGSAAQRAEAKELLAEIR